MGFLYVKTADGKKRASVWVWVILLVILLGASVFFVTNKRETGMEQMIKGQQREDNLEVSKIAKDETNKNTEDMDTDAVNKMNEQIAREEEENGGWISNERKAEIRDKYIAETENKQSSNFNPSVDKRLEGFLDPEPTPTPIAQPQVQQQEKVENYMTLDDRLKAEGIEKKAMGSKSRATEFGNKKETKQERENKIRQQGGARSQEFEKVANLLPMGTFIPCVLESDVVTSDLTSHVWATVVLDVTFRRQMQLPKGLVKLRGKTASEPVQNMVDIYFDVMLFSDGTELPIEGFAYAAFDPRYPTRFKVRGVPGEMIVPPMYVKLQSLVYSAALGASDAYIQNYINENTSTPSTFTTVPTINPVTGQVTSVIQQQQGQPVNNAIGETVALSAGQSALEDLVKKAKEDLEKYRPYVIVEKGTPIFVQIDKTIDVSKRQINGVEIAKALAAEAAANGGKPVKDPNPIFPPGDARAQYTGSRPSGDSTDGMQGGVLDTSSAFFDKLQNLDPDTQKRLQEAQAGLSNALKMQQQERGGSTTPAENNDAELQAILDNMGN